MKQEFNDVFGAFISVMHPADLPGEVKGKGANISYAGKHVAQLLRDQGEDFSKIIVTTLDADNRLHPSYFANLTYYYCLTEDRKKRSFQPLPLFYNNIWQIRNFFSDYLAHNQRQLALPS